MLTFLHGLKMCVCFWVIFSLFVIIFSHFFDLVFPGPISIGKDTLCLLEFSTDHFETMHICSTWSEDVCVVLGLSSYYTDLKLTTIY